MQFNTHNQVSIDNNGTHLQGYINCDYQTLIKIFGHPLHSGFDNYKTDAEWHIKFADQSVATIYNWKNGYNYLGTAGKAVSQIKQWNVGGFDKHAVERVSSAIMEYANVKSFTQIG
jgi:hypothetical protein